MVKGIFGAYIGALKPFQVINEGNKPKELRHQIQILQCHLK
jgi:hypothetical protein